MKKIVLFISMILGSYFASSQIIGSGLRCFMANLNSPKVEKEMFPQRFSLQTIDGKQYISLVAKVSSDATNEEIEKVGCKVRSRSGNILSLRAEVNMLEKLVTSD